MTLWQVDWRKRQFASAVSSSRQHSSAHGHASPSPAHSTRHHSSLTSSASGNDWPTISFEWRYRTTDCGASRGKSGRSTNIGKFLVPASNEAPGRRVGVKGVLRGFVHPAWPDHHWGYLINLPTTLRLSSVAGLAMLFATRRASSIVSTLLSLNVQRHRRRLPLW